MSKSRKRCAVPAILPVGCIENGTEARKRKQVTNGTSYLLTRSKTQTTSRFVDVCRRGDWDQAKRRLQTHPQDVHWIQSRDGSTALHCLVKSNERDPAPRALYLSVLKSLNPANIMKQDKLGKTVFHYAVSSSSRASLDVLEVLLQAANNHLADSLERLFQRVPALNQVPLDVIRNEIVSYIGDEPLMVQDKLGYTALHSWLMWGPYGTYGEYVEFYMKNAPYVSNILSNRGANPLHILCRSLASWSRIDSLQAFLQYCPANELLKVLSTQDSEYKRTPLHSAIDGIFSHVSFPSYDAIRLLLMAHPDAALDSFDQNGNSPVSTILNQFLSGADNTLLNLLFAMIPLRSWLSVDLNAVSGGRSHFLLMELTMRYYNGVLVTY